MSDSRTIWTELGIASTSDRAAIRRAYAQRLKTIEQSYEPEAFAALRHAYETALNLTSSSAPITPAQAVAPSPNTVEPTAPTEARVSATGQAIHQTLAARDITNAARLLLEARRDCSLPLSEDITLANQLLWALAHDRKLDGGTVRAVAHRLGWQDYGTNYRRSPDMEKLSHRIEAERWYDSLLESARTHRFRLGGKGPAARLLLGRGPAPLIAVLFPGTAIAQALAGLTVHRGWLNDRFDLARIRHLEQLATSRRALFLRKNRLRVARTIYLTWILFWVGIMAWGVRGH